MQFLYIASVINCGGCVANAATKPDNAFGKRKPVAHGFKLSADGRLIITDDSLQQGGNFK